MSKDLTLAITKIGDLLLHNKITTDKNGHPIENINLLIPEYQRPYKWTAKNSNQLLDDIIYAKNENKEVYRVGTLILHKDEKGYNIVDGQQRTMTFSLLLEALGENNIAFLCQSVTDNSYNKFNIINNYRALKRRVDSLTTAKEDVLDYVINNCELIVVITEDISEAFQFFDSQNARGKKLYPHDLLKAYHLREMKDMEVAETEKIVKIWEDLNQKELAELFSEYLYRLKEWIKGNKSYELDEHNIELFKGITGQDNFPYAQFYKGAYAYADNINRSYIPFVTGMQNLSSFQLDTPIIAGKPFFDYAKHYFDILTDIRNNDKYEGYFINDNEIIKTLNLRKYRNGVGNRIVRLLLDTAILLYVDRFCPEKPRKYDTEMLEQFVVYAFVWAYSLRAQYQNLGWQAAQNYIMGDSNRELLNSFNLYKVITESDSPVALLSTLSNKIMPLSYIDLPAFDKNKAEKLGNIDDKEDGIYEELFTLFCRTQFLEGTKMRSTILPLKELSVTELYNGSNKLIFEVPIYQRNYAWEKDEVATLIQDVYDAYKNDSDVYFIGTLVTYHKGDNIYEVIDGQQRLTTINLILNALGIRPNNQLTYKARKKSNETIKHIPDFNTDEKDYGIINGFKYAKTAIGEIVESESLKEFINFFQNNVHIIHYEVPRDINLNHYFEIMNSRGEQLEKHEIIKARLISSLVDDKDKVLFNYIWECCSEMGVYIQQKYNDKNVFDNNMCELVIDTFEDLSCGEEKINEATSIKYLIENEESIELSNPNDSDDKPDSFQAIIDFPNFLLTVLKITRIINEKKFVPVNFNLDDKELINEFERVPFDEYGGKSCFAKKFAYNLLKAKFLLDNYIVHHSKEEDTIDNNPWKLQYWHKERKQGALRNLCDNDNRQQNLLQLLSMFEVSFTARQRKNYLFYCLLFLFGKYNSKSVDVDILPEYEEFLEKLATKYFFDVYLVGHKLNNINVPKPGSFDDAILENNLINLETNGVNISNFELIYGNGTIASKGVPLFVFNYVDYKLWRYYAKNLRGEKLKEGSVERIAFFDKLGCGDFGLDVFKQFYFSRTRRSLEHYYPQANVSKDGINNDQINCIGNYAMIGSEANSSGSNWSPKTKLDHYLDSSGKMKQVSIASIKFMIMMQKCKDNQNTRNPGDEWVFFNIKEHQDRMLSFMSDNV